jgi:drug/metabolite transporter (DMT)-like permease
MTITAAAIYFRGGRRMTWQRVAALGLLVGGAVAAAAFHNEILAATFAGAAAGFAVNRDPDRNGGSAVTPPAAH